MRFFGVLFLFLIAACGSKNQAPQVPLNSLGGVSPKNPDAIYHGPITTALNELTKSLDQLKNAGNPSSCDTKNMAHEYEIAAAIDAKADAILAYASQPHQVYSNFTKVDFGDGYLKRYSGDRKPDPTWMAVEDSWDEVYANYLKIKDLPVNAAWLSLDADARSLITDDIRRLIYHDHMGIGFDSEPAILWMQERVGFRKNSAVKVTKDASGNIVYSLPLDATAFSDVQRNILKDLFESAWTYKNARIEITWTDKKLNPDVYTLNWDQQLGERSETNYKKHTVLFHIGSRTTEVSHEIGHVMGLKDHYYTVWSPAKCSYEIQLNTADIMSNDALGAGGTEEEFKKFAEEYGVQ